MNAMTNPTSRAPLPLLMLNALPFAALAAVLYAGALCASPATSAAAGTAPAARMAPAAAASEARKNASLLRPEEKSTVAFRRIVLVEADGSRLTVEEDGEVWWSAARTRRLVRTLSPDEMEALRAALARAEVEEWQPGDATGAFGRSRLAVLLMSGETRSVALPPPGLEGQHLLALLRALASG